MYHTWEQGATHAWKIKTYALHMTLQMNGGYYIKKIMFQLKEMRNVEKGK